MIILTKILLFAVTMMVTTSLTFAMANATATTTITPEVINKVCTEDHECEFTVRTEDDKQKLLSQHPNANLDIEVDQDCCQDNTNSNNNDDDEQDTNNDDSSQEQPSQNNFQPIPQAPETGSNNQRLGNNLGGSGNGFGQSGNQFNPFAQGGGGQEEGFSKGSSGLKATELYENPLYKLKIPYPSNWVVDETRKGEVIFAPQIETTPHISLISTEVSSYNPERLKFIADGLKQIALDGGATIVDEEQFTINGREAYFFTYTWTGQDSGRNYKDATTVTGNDNFVYAFQLAGTPVDEFDNLMSVLNTMVLEADQFDPFGQSRSADATPEETTFRTNQT